KEEVIGALKCIDDIKKYYDNRLDLLASTIVWGMVAPLSFVLKQIGAPFLKWLVFWGVTNASKSSSGCIPLAFDGHHNDSNFIKGKGALDSVPRLGDLVSKTTFPKMVNEVNLDSLTMEEILEYMKIG